MDEISDRELWIRRAIFAIVVLFLFWLIVIRGCEPSEEEKVFELYDSRNFYLACRHRIETEPLSEVRALLVGIFQDLVQETDAKLAKYPEAIRIRVRKQNEDVLQKRYQFYLEVSRAEPSIDNYDYRFDGRDWGLDYGRYGP